MTDRVQVGVTVSEHVWKEFREDVKQRKGQVRGVLGDELETAIREYLHTASEETDTERIRRVDERLARIENKLGTATADGGTHAADGPTHTHTPTACDSAKPPANAPRTEKVEYLANRLVAEHGGGDDPVGTLGVQADRVVDLIQREYDFGERTAPDYVDRIADHLDLRPHPKNPDVYLGEIAYANAVESLEETARDDINEAIYD